MTTPELEKLVIVGEEGQCCNCGKGCAPVYGPKNPRAFDVYLGRCCNGHKLTLAQARELVGLESDEKLVGDDDEAKHLTITHEARGDK